MSLGATVRNTAPQRRFYNTVPAQTLIALSFNILSLFAGGLISVFIPQFQGAPWILALFPPILTIRGGIGGVFSGNLATMLHLGIIRPKIKGNTPAYSQLISASLAITLLDTLVMGFIAFTLNLILGKASIRLFPIYVAVPTVACVVALAISIPLTSLIAIATFRRGLNPDILVYPILASINDIVVTASFVATVFLVLMGGIFQIVLGLGFLSILGLSAFLIWRNRKVKLFFKTIREGTTAVIISSLLGSVNGVFLSRLNVDLLRHPGIVVVYPALNNALGNIGSIVGSTMTTSLALGTIKSLKEEVINGVKTVFHVESAAFLMHSIFGVVTYLFVSHSNPGADPWFLVRIALYSNLSSFLVISLFAFAIAYLSFERGLNPDNVVIPVITSVSDTVATLSLIAVLTFFT